MLTDICKKYTKFYIRLCAEEFLNKKYNRLIVPKYLPKRSGDIKESVCNNNKIKELLNIHEFTNFEEGLNTL